ncbi:hypothetical protein PRIPAC_74978 [Pristionchus pacificus]|uniref:Uncharacterized protein n=1 Tax=Pristionchus pacificus TaxID=54126 RepID=A0A2A6CTA2_PRIPA|nr:hypothetical protein PRIPAC_74978 [Pristionchus pacificus]|eukprot:PDM81287.1 hypothetical protein PRIPAC_36290 [Pristionchus pacificus]
MSPLSSLILIIVLSIGISTALPLLQKSSPSSTFSPSQLEDIPDLLPELEDEYPDIEKRDLEELYPYGLSSDLMDLLPELPRTDRKPHLEPSILLSARQQILPYI